MVCNGSSEFLKNRFGTGYVLTVVVNHDDPLCKDSESVINNILKVTHKHAPSARIDKIAFPQFSIILPTNRKA